jgi:hypothetical protein
MIHLDWPNVVMGAILGFPLAIAASWYWERLQAAERRRRNAIRIDSPRPGETLNERDARRIQGLRCFEITGRLGFVPEGHAIWVLVQAVGGEQIWPQGFESVKFDDRSHQWSGHFYAPDHDSQVQIVAVVAPPTSREFFTYYQHQVGATRAAPLSRIPYECKNYASVVAQVP